MSARTKAVASDLDRTLIWSVNAAGGDVGDAICVETYAGAPLSFLTPTAAGAIRGLLEQGLLVPVTTRTTEQYQRIELPGGPARLAVCANGGVLLVDGAADAGFADLVRNTLLAGAELIEVTELFTRWCTAQPDGLGGGPARVRTAEGLFCYAVFPAALGPDPAFDVLAGLLAGAGWRLSVQGRKVYCVPDALSKWSALEYVAERFGLDFVLAAGDSRLDADLLLGVGAGLVPRDSELARAGWTAPGQRLTAEPGLAAGEEIALALGAAVRG